MTPLQEDLRRLRAELADTLSRNKTPIESVVVLWALKAEVALSNAIDERPLETV